MGVEHPLELSVIKLKILTYEHSMSFVVSMIILFYAVSITT